MLLRTTSAAFTGSSANASSWTTGSVVLTDDTAGSAMFSSAADGLLTGGQTLTRCIRVTYSGTLTTAVAVKLYVTSTSGVLPTYLNLTVDEGTGGVTGSCTSFTPTTSGIYSGTLAGFATASSSFGTGVGSWAPTSTGATRSYRFTVSPQSVAAAQATSATATFTWEARA